MAAARTYMVWMFQQRGRNDKIGELAKDAFMDPNWDGKQQSLKKITKGTAAEDPYYESITLYRKWAEEFAGRSAPKSPPKSPPVEEQAPKSPLPEEPAIIPVVINRPQRRRLVPRKSLIVTPENKQVSV